MFCGGCQRVGALWLSEKGSRSSKTANAKTSTVFKNGLG